jgi:hypothetical protein
MQPPDIMVKGMVMLLNICPIQHLQNFSLQAAHAALSALIWLPLGNMNPARFCGEVGTAAVDAVVVASWAPTVSTHATTKAKARNPNFLRFIASSPNLIHFRNFHRR